MQTVEVYVDYLCPYAHAGAAWLREVRSQLNGELAIKWRFFPLEQVNSDKGPDWKVWEQDLDHQTRGWVGFRAALAALEQGEDAFERFHFAWFNGLHETPVGKKRPTVFEVAENVGLDLAKFETDFENKALWARVGEDYEHGRSELGVFGTPTVVFPSGSSAYIQMRPTASKEDAIPVWNDFVTTIVGRPFIKEIKRPTKPE